MQQPTSPPTSFHTNAKAPSWKLPNEQEANIVLLAERLALKLTKGDIIALYGDLGAGKTTFARALIRAVLDDPTAEVPSPTFAILQTYEAPRLELAHIDLYRLSTEDEAHELGIEDLAAHGTLLIEWPDRAPSLLSANRLDVTLAMGDTPETRTISITAHGTWQPRLARLQEMAAFLTTATPWDQAHLTYLQGDASARSYARLTIDGRRAVLMDQPRQPDGPPIRNGQPYSRIAHLAEDVRPFTAIAKALRDANLSAPEIYAEDLERGFLVLEDFGTRVFGQEMLQGTPQAVLWRAAVDTLVALASAPAPNTATSDYFIPPQDKNVLAIEVELLPDWYWPATYNGAAIPTSARDTFMSSWEKLFDSVLAGPKGWVLRDYHSPNLMWLPERDSARRAGLLDFQDALEGSPAYDLVSLLQDARVDVAAELETELLEHYVAERSREASFDATEFRFAYAVLGAQRNTKILGIFARLAKRDHKPQYLRHIPRIWRYLEKCLQHPELSSLRVWYDTHFPSQHRVISSVSRA